MMIRKDREKEFQDYFRREKTVSGWTIIDQEIPLFRMFSNETSMYPIGRADVSFSRNNSSLKYLAEIKWTSSPDDFWLSLKILGYLSYLKMTSKKFKNYVPAIIIPGAYFCAELSLIADSLGITVFIVSEDNGRFTLEKISQAPNNR